MAGLPQGVEILRFVDVISREKSVDKGTVFEALEQALALAAKKHLQRKEIPEVRIDRDTGSITAWDGEEQIDTSVLGRIEYQAAHQMFIQRIREAESDTVFYEFAHKKGDIVSATVLRTEGRNVICKIGHKAEASMVKNDQVPGESYRVGDRLRAFVAEVERRGTRVTVYITRAGEEFVLRLFALEVPEISDGTVEVKGVAREPGYRTKITVTSVNDRVDCLGACVGVRGSRIRNVVDELNGENVDIVRWSEDPSTLIKNSLKPAEVSEVILDEEVQRATVYVLKDQLSQAIGKGGRNVRLASKLTGWEIDIYELGADLEEGEEADQNVPVEGEEPTETPSPEETVPVESASAEGAETPEEGAETSEEGSETPEEGAETSEEGSESTEDEGSGEDENTSSEPMEDNIEPEEGPSPAVSGDSDPIEDSSPGTETPAEEPKTAE
ncbi:MAG: transcription termination factor NusA [Planctomycetota bacterium]|nr:transcription termination factor NusA [Planctomycetota bacterium]